MRQISLCLLVLFLVGCKSTPSQTVFSSPGAAVEGLVGALRTNDTAKLDKIFGEDGTAILSSGDPVADHNDVAKFLQEYDIRHEMVVSSPENAEVTLVIGQNAWPFPVPIVKVDKGWVFDTEAGRDEILNRRIGRNELDTIQVCQAIVDAQSEYARLDPEKVGLPVYAQKIVSEPGKKNGLYWPANEGEPVSPLGELVAEAADEGYGRSTKNEHGESAPYKGYHYRLLTSQGDDAKGGAMEYLVDGKLIGGFALVAYPAEYENSGVMTFIVSHDGIVYQKDLGAETQSLARKMTTFNPGEGWKPVPPAEAAPEK